MNDDDPIGQLLSRREALGVLGAAGLVFISGSKSRSLLHRSNGPVLDRCVVRPAQTSGPFFIDQMLNRSDIRADQSGTLKPGLPLELSFNVSKIAAATCAPLAGAVVDVWHCDADGVYSDERDPGFHSAGERWLRGYQVTDPNGVARFTTIFPGWYRGRAVHIHFKIRSPANLTPGYDFTSQLYFDDSVTDKVHARPPYASRGQRAQRNGDDGIFRRDGSQLILAVTPDGQGYKGSFDVSLQVG